VSANPLSAALQALTLPDPYALARAQAMVIGYHTVWETEDVEVIAVEREFVAPLIHPDGTEDPEWLLSGKIDLVARWNGILTGFDHKTSSESPSSFRTRLGMNAQATQYMEGAGSLGFDLQRFVFDVLFKPALDPYEATPPEQRKYRKGDGQLYATQRAEDERPEDYRARICQAIEESPEKLFQRMEVLRLASEREAYRATLSKDSILMDTVRQYELHAPNENACFGYGRNCEFLPVCLGQASLDDVTLYRRKASIHEELEASIPAGRRLLTNSRRQCFNRCRRLHHFQYEQGYRAVSGDTNTTFGTAVHKAIEAMWKAWPRQAKEAA
jgi:hypothetical protein